MPVPSLDCVQLKENEEICRIGEYMRTENIVRYDHDSDIHYNGSVSKYFCNFKWKKWKSVKHFLFLDDCIIIISNTEGRAKLLETFFSFLQ